MKVDWKEEEGIVRERKMKELAFEGPNPSKAKIIQGKQEMI